MANNQKQFIYLLLSFLTLVAGYTYLRYAYHVTDKTPFTQEIVLIILGTVATIFITALLLNQQTAVEIEKEQSIKFFELKADTYKKLLDLLESMSMVDSFSTDELTRLRFITHRLTIVASADVLVEYQKFLKVVSEISEDNSFHGDAAKLSKALGLLTFQIRQDLVGEQKPPKYGKEKMLTIIRDNSNQSLELGGN